MAVSISSLLSLWYIECLRELRDILKSLKPIVDVLFLLLFIIFVFSLVGKFSISQSSWDLQIHLHTIATTTCMYIGYYIFAEVDPSVSELLDHIIAMCVMVG